MIAFNKKKKKKERKKENLLSTFFFAKAIAWVSILPRPFQLLNPSLAYCIVDKHLKITHINDTHLLRMVMFFVSVSNIALFLDLVLFTYTVLSDVSFYTTIPCS